MIFISFVVNHGDSARTSRVWQRSQTLAPRAGDAIHPVLWIQGGVRARLMKHNKIEFFKSNFFACVNLLLRSWTKDAFFLSSKSSSEPAWGPRKEINRVRRDRICMEPMTFAPSTLHREC